MNRAAHIAWPEANQRYLTAALAVLRDALEQHAAQPPGGSQAVAQPGRAQQALHDAADAMPAPSALETLCATFGLSTFERAVLLLCAGVELDSSFAPLCASAQGDPSRTYPTFSLALAALPEPHWNALTPAGLLRHWRLIELGAGSSLTLSPLRIDECVLHFLTGTPHLDERLVGLVEPAPSAVDLVPSHAALAERIAAAWSQASGRSTLPVIQLCGDELEAPDAARAIAVARLIERTAGPLLVQLWDACRVQARPRLDNLAQRIEPAASWDDLVLPELQRETLREIAAHVRHRAIVYEDWGFASKGLRGLGISALFAGASGTGKTMAAEVLASELRLDLYRIDLSAVVSKYIGETEKNLRRVFDAAEVGGAILLFDEADALFGKRSEVKDSHDRYANIEVSYLLQRMESYRGLAILTTNMKSALDSAFLRRIRFIVQFPFPDAAQRADIWRRIFPTNTPTQGLDVAKLSRLNVAGGHIRNIAMNAAFLAADASEPVRMPHLLRAARSEYAKLEKPLTESEIGGWT
jgi:hypothetical protein